MLAFDLSAILNDARGLKYHLMRCVMPAETAEHSSHAMQCMEIWGNNGVADMTAGTPGLEVLVRSRPFAAAERGGDIHYVTLCASGKLTRTILADVAGHGGEVDAIARQLRDLLRKNINTFNQKHLVRDLKQSVFGLDGGEEIRDGGGGDDYDAEECADAVQCGASAAAVLFGAGEDVAVVDRGGGDGGGFAAGGGGGGAV